jgi:TRAP transporter TAXI family solute receptor
MARFIWFYVAASFALTLTLPALSADRFIAIGTGSETGVYYPSGGAICKFVNQGRRQHNLLCSIEATGGSIFNVNTLRAGHLDFAIVQSDWQYHGYMGSGPFLHHGSFEKMRSVFSLYTEPFNIITRSDTNIQTIEDLVGKRINIGNADSGDRATMQVVMNAFDWNNESFKLAAELRGAERSQALCENKLDAYIYMVGHPNDSIGEATTSCNAKIISVTGKEIEQIIANHSYYTVTTIAPETYKGQTDPIQSFGVAATLITTSDISDDVVYSLVKSVFEHFEQFKQSHPALANLQKEQMVQASLSAPLHPGAERYYREVGLIEE